jgi:hypothetical protein
MANAIPVNSEPNAEPTKPIKAPKVPKMAQPDFTEAEYVAGKPKSVTKQGDTLIEDY